MHPYLTLNLFNDRIVLASSNVFLVTSIILATVILTLALRPEVRLLSSIGMALTTAMSTLLGGRLLHVVWERPEYFLHHPSEILTRLDGLVLYGGLVAGIVVFARLLKSYPLPVRQKAWDVAAITGAFLVGVLRIACFAEGCCWGKPTRVSWAVRYYDPSSSMPWLGIPVHPVQLYESAAGFLIAAGLIWLHRRYSRFSGLLVYLFCIEYSIARFILEDFRGDSFRGVDLIVGLSTSQVLSVAIGGTASALLVSQLSRRTHAKFLLRSTNAASVRNAT